MNDISLHPDLLGEPRIDLYTEVGTGAGPIDCFITPPLGEIWILKGAQAYHDEAVTLITVRFDLQDAITGRQLYIGGGAVLANVVAPMQPGLYLLGQPLLCLGGITLRAQFGNGVIDPALGTNCNLEFLVNKIKGAWPLV